MADIPTVDGPRAQQSGAGTSSATIPGAFGADVAAKGLAQVGQAAGEASTQFAQSAERIQQLHNDAAVAQHSMDVFDKGTQITEKYKLLSLNAAVAAYPQYRADMESLVQQGGQGLAPAALPQYLQQTRRFAMSQLEVAGNHAATQGNAYLHQTQNAMADTTGNALVAAGAPGSSAYALAEENFHAALGTYTTTLIQQTGLDPTKPGDAALIRADLQKFTSKTYGTIISNRIAAGNFDDAKKLLDLHSQAGDLNDETIAQLTRTFAVKSSAEDTATAASAAYHGGTYGGSGDPSQFFHEFIVPHEGSATVTDSNGAKVQYGINAKSYPNEKVGSLSEAEAGAIYQRDYARGDLPPAMSAVYGDTAFMTGKGEADKLLASAGGDPQKFLDLRQQFLGSLVDRNPAKYGKYAQTWEQRTADLRQYVAGLGTGAGVTVQGVPPPTASDNPDTYLAAAKLRIEANAQAMFPNDVERREKVIAYGEMMAKRDVDPISQSQKAAGEQIWLGLQQQPNIQDTTQLKQQFPAQYALIANRPDLLGQIEEHVRGTSNIPTAVRLDNENSALATLKSGDMNAVRNLNLDAPDMTARGREQLKKLQIETEAHGFKVDPVEQSILHSPEYAQALQAAQFMIEPDGKNVTDTQKRGYLVAKSQFEGAVLGEVQNWRGQPGNQGKSPSQDDVSGMIARVVARNGHGQFLALPPTNIRQEIIQSYQARWGAVPTEGQVASIYATGRASGKVKYGQ